MATVSARPVQLSPTVVIVAGWLAAALVAGAAGVFDAGPGGAPIALGVAAAGPPLAVLALLGYSARFRAWVAGLDLTTLTMLQMWRIAGFTFVPLWAVGALPGGFALPAGIGDVLVGLTAPLVALHLVGRGRAATSAFLAWTAFGIADLLNAVTLGVLHSGGPIGLLSDGLSTDIMGSLPLSLVPTFGVPLTLVLHILSLANLRANRP